MLKWVAIALALLLPCIVQAQQAPPATSKPAPSKPAPKPAKKPAKPPDRVPLANIVQAVELVVDAYNIRPDVTTGVLPPLKTADFDFKTVVDVKGGPSINFWIFKAGYSHEKQSTNDVTFQYIPQPIKPEAAVGPYAMVIKEDLSDELTKAIESAATQIKGEKESDKNPLALKLNQLAITLAFQVSNDYSGGVNIPIHMVTLGGTLDYNRADVQSVKLTFVFPDKKPDK
jgi:hypothetical protein